MEGLQISSFNAVEDFETVAANVRVKIYTYFSQLLEIIRNRQTNLISELDDILSRYRQGRARQRDKVRELEEIKKYHEDRSSSSTVKHLQDGILNRINSELAELRKKANSMSVEFEWSQTYARDVSKIGKLKYALFYSQSQYDTPLPTNIQPGVSSKIGKLKETCSDVIMMGTDCSSFIFSRRLYEGLIYRTDVGPIPRDSYREEHMSSEFANTANWRRAIEGCYWCGGPTRSNQYTYVCDKKCFSLLHEWCRRKLCEFCGDSLCMLPGCEQVAVESANCCSETHQQQLEKKYKTIKKGKDTNLGTGAYWYEKKEILTNKKTTQFFPGKQHQQQQKQKQKRQQQLPFILDRTLTELLMTLTDIGPIPRDLLTYPRIIQASQQFLQIPSNWNTSIVGCYWCCTNMSCYLGIFCDKRCFYLFNEWCFLKLRERDPSISCCKYVGCTKSSDNSSQCCKDHARQYLSEYGKFSQLLKTTNFILGPRWYNNNSTLNTVEFYNRDEPFYEFTNFFACNSLNMDGISYPTSEHYFQSQEFVGTPYMRHISSMSNARESFDFSRSSRGTRWLRPDWGEVKERVMYRVLREKFIQNPELAYMLVSTCNAQIFEHTSNDSYWGDGGDGTGKNRLGILLMKLRDELQTEYTYFPNTLSHHTYDKLCNEYVLKPTSPLMPSVQPQSNSLSPVDFNLRSIKSSFNGHNSFKQMRNTDSDRISDDDNISPNHTSARGNSSTDSTHGVFLKPTNCTHSSPQDAERGDKPPPYNPGYITPTDVSGGEAAKPRDQTDHPESMET